MTIYINEIRCLLTGGVFFLAALHASNSLAEPLSSEQVSTVLHQPKGGTHRVEDTRSPTGVVLEVSLESSEDPLDAVGKALEKVPGVQRLESSSTGHTQLLRVRGGNPRQLSVFIEGIRWSPSVGLGFDVGSLSTLGLEKLRLFMGPAAASFGNSSVTGALVLSTTYPDHDGITLDGSFGVGSFRRWHLNRTISLKIGDLWMNGGIGYAFSRGDFIFEDEDPHNPTIEVVRSNNDARNTLLFGSIGYHLGSIGELSFLARLKFNKTGVPGPAQFQKKMSGARLNGTDFLSILSYKRPTPFLLGHAEINPEVTLGYQQDSSEYQNSSTLLGSAPMEVKQRTDTYTVRSGLEIWLPLSRFFGFNELEVEIASQTRLNYTFRHERLKNKEQGFLNDLFEVARNEHLLVGSESLRFTYFPWRSAFEIFSGLQFFNLASQELFPFVGALIEWNEIIGIRGNIAKNYRAPFFDELYKQNEVVSGDPSLKPEYTKSYDLTLYGNYRGDTIEAEGRVTYYRNNIRDAIYFLPISAYQIRAQNIHALYSNGIETSVEVGYMPWVSLKSTFAYTDASLKDPPHPVPGIATYTSSSTLSVDLTALLSQPFDKLQFSASVFYRSPITLDFFGSLVSPSSTVVDTDITFGFFSTVTLGLKISNLFDNRHRVNLLDYPLPGRSFYFTAQMKTP